MSDLSEKVRGLAEEERGQSAITLHRAADELESLASERDALRAALERIAGGAPSWRAIAREALRGTVTEVRDE